MTEERKRANFERIAAKRVNEILEAIEQLKNLGNTSFYLFERKDLDKIYDAIELANKEAYNYLMNKKARHFHL